MKKSVSTCIQPLFRYSLIVFILCLFSISVSYGQKSTANDNLEKAQKLLSAGQKVINSKPEDGIFWLKEAQFIFKNNEKHAQEVDCILALSEIHLRLSDYDVAYSLLTNASSMAMEYNLHPQQIMALSSLGRISGYMGEYARADEFLKDGIDRAEEYGMENEKLYMAATRAYIRVYFSQEYTERHFKTIENAFRTIAKQRPIDSLMLLPLTNCYAGALYFVKKDIPAAEKHYANALELARLMGDLWRYALYSNNFGDMLREKGRVNEAEILFTKSLSDARQINSKLLIYNGLKHLSSCAEDRGDFKKALSLYKNYVDVKAQVLSEDLIRKTRQIYSLYQLERKARENDRFRMEKIQEKQLADSQVKIYQILSLAISVLLLVFLFLFYANRRSLRRNVAQRSIIEQQNTKLQDLNKNLWEQRKMADTSREEAEKAIRSKIDFFSIITHEIRTPLNAVIGTVQHLEDEQVAPHQNKSLEILKFSADNLLNLVNDILDFNRIEAKKIELENKPFSLAFLLQNIRNSLQMQADEKGIALNLRLDKEIPLAFSGDRLRIGQIFYNLVSNAIKFTDRGSVDIEIRYYRDSENANVKATIRDTGIGIAPDKQKGIFEFFSQADPSITRKFGGSGLGLTITKNLLSLMDSAIELESTLGKGSSFSFYLNLPEANARFIAENQEIAIGTVDMLEGAKVLFVEDVAYNRVVAERFFKKWKLQFHTADDGLSAIELAKENDYDLILMDLQLPDMDGFQTTDIIKAIPRHEKTVILAMTASSHFEIKDKLEEFGINGYISKPFVAQELRNILQQWLSYNKDHKNTVSV